MNFLCIQMENVRMLLHMALSDQYNQLKKLVLNKIHLHVLTQAVIDG